MLHQHDNPSVTASPCHLPLHKGAFKKFCKVWKKRLIRNFLVSKNRRIGNAMRRFLIVFCGGKIANAASSD